MGANQQRHFMMQRREFHRRLAAATFSTCGFTARSAEGADAKYPPVPFFDIHTHIGQAANHTPPLSAEELLRWMDAHDVAEAAVLPLASPESSAYLITPDFVLAATKPYRDRLIPFCSIDPRTDYSGGERGLRAMVKRYVDEGCRGFGEHKPGVAIDDPRNMKLYAACAEFKLPVLVHLDNFRNMDAPGLPGFAKVLEAFPTVNFLGHAMGWWASITGGVTQEEFGRSPRPSPVASGGAIDALMDKYPNIYGDLSASTGAAAIRRDMKFGREFVIRRADRLVFGTDFHFPGQQIPQFDLYRELDLPLDVARKIFRDNARRLLNMPI